MIAKVLARGSSVSEPSPACLAVSIGFKKPGDIKVLRNESSKHFLMMNHRIIEHARKQRREVEVLFEDPKGLENQENEGNETELLYRLE